MKCDFLQTRILSVFNLLKRVGFAVLLVVATVLVQAQPPDTLWTRRYGRQYYDIAHSVAQTPDGGFIIAGETWNAEVFETRNADAYVVKVDSLGNEEWNHSWGWEYSEHISKLIVLDDGFIAAGAVGMFPPANPEPSLGWLLRLDSLGDTMWTKLLGNETGGTWFEDMIAVENGNYVAIGRSRYSGSPDLWVAKFSVEGDTIWTRSFGGSAWDYGWAITLASDSGYVVCGYTDSFGAGSSDFWLIKVSQDGDSLWSRTFGFGGLEEARAIELAPDGGFFLGGYSESLSATYDDAWIVRTDSLGNYLWDKDLAGEFQLGIEALVATEDGGVIAAGRDDPAGTNGQALYIAKVDSSGDSVWARSWFQDWYSYGRDLISLPNGGFVAVGGEGSHSDPEHRTGDMWFIRLSPDFTPVSPLEPYLPSQLEMSVYPNPFNSTLSISLNVPLHQEVTVSLYDLLGREVDVVYRGRLSSSTVSYVAPAALSSGVYFLRASAGERSVLGKVVLLK